MDIRKLFRPDKDKIYDKGVDALKRGDFDGAAKHFAKVVELDQGDARAWYNLAYCCESLKQYGRAAECFKRYMTLDASGADVDLPELVEVLEKAGNVATSQAEEIIEEYRSKVERASREARVGDIQITLEMLLKEADGLLYSDKFLRNEPVASFAKAMSAKIPLRFYAVKLLQDMNPRDAFGFGTAFAASGYAVAKVSLRLLGEMTYLATLSQEVVRDLTGEQGERGFPISYKEPTLRTGNPIPWRLVKRALDECIEGNLAKFLEKSPRARIAAETVRSHLVREFVYTGYYIGLCENARAKK